MPVRVETSTCGAVYRGGMPASHGQRATPRVAVSTAVLHPHLLVGEPKPHGMSAPIERSATFALDEVSEHALSSGVGYEQLDIYGRYGGPTQRAAAQTIAALEGAQAALMLSSGIAAIRLALLSVLPESGGRILAAQSIYGATESFLASEVTTLRREVARFDATNAASLTALLDRPADAIYVESISNPCVEVADLQRICELGQRANVPVLVDATFGGGMNHRAFALGARLVIHSATKYLNGHSDVIAGAVAGSQSDIDRVHALVVRHGSCIDPNAAWLVQRGLKSLPVRWRAQVHTAGFLALRLVTHPAVRKVMYPGLFNAAEPGMRPRWELGRLPTFLSDAGAMLSFELSDAQTARRVADSLQVITHATSLGGVESLISIPARSSHAGLAAEARAAVGISDGLLRLSVGLEDADDLWADLVAALAPS